MTLIPLIILLFITIIFYKYNSQKNKKPKIALIIICLAVGIAIFYQNTNNDISIKSASTDIKNPTIIDIMSHSFPDSSDTSILSSSI